MTIRQKTIDEILTANNGGRKGVSLSIVPESRIAAVQGKTDINFPSDLRDLWTKLGEGFLSEALSELPVRRFDQIQRIIGPEEAAELMTSEWEKDVPRFQGRIPFYNVLDLDFLVVAQDGRIEHVDFPGTTLNESLGDFLEKVIQDPAYWEAILENLATKDVDP